MKHFEKMVEHYRNHPEEAKNILKHAGKLDETKWKQTTMTKEELFEIIVSIVALPNTTEEQQKRRAIQVLLAFDEYASWHWQDQEDIMCPWVDRSDLDFEELAEKILNELDKK